MLGKEIRENELSENLVFALLDSKGTLTRNNAFFYGDTIEIKNSGDLIRLDDGNFVVSVALKKDSLNKVISYVSSFGDIFWNRTTGQVTDLDADLPVSKSTLLNVPHERIFHADITSGNNSTTDILLTGMNYWGDLEFVRTISLGNDINEQILDMRIGVDSTIMVLGTTDDANAPVFLSKMDTLGNIVWTKSYNGDFGRILDMDGYDLVQLQDSSWVILGSVQPTMTERHSGFLLQVDNDGGLLKSQRIDPISTRYQLYPNGLIGTSDTTLIISMARLDMITDVIQPLVVHFDRDSSIIYETILDTCTSVLPSISELVSGDSVSVGYMTTTSKEERRIPYLAKLDEQGTTQCEETESIVMIDTTLFTSSDLSFMVDSVSFSDDSIKTTVGIFNDFSPPILQLQDTLFCPQDPVLYFQDATVRGGVGYLWEDNSMNPMRTFTEAGMYMVTVVVREDICFTLCDTMTISQLEFPQVSIGRNNNFCEDGTITLIAETSGASITRFEWSDGSTASTLVVDGTPQEYSVLVEDGCGNTAMATTSIGPDDLPAPVNVSIEQGCDGLTVVGSGFISQVWSTGETTETIEVDEPGTFSVVVQDECGDDVEAVEITLDADDFPPPIDAQIVLECGSPRVLTIVGDGFTSVEWNTGETSESIEIDASGTFSATLTGEAIQINGATCQQTELLNLSVSESEFMESSGCLLWPNALHPLNREIENQTFAPRVSSRCENSIVSYELQIYNRWGKNIFTSTDVNIGWNGTINGSPQPGGVYYYWAVYDDGNTVCEREGDITLLR